MPELSLAHSDENREDQGATDENSSSKVVSLHPRCKVKPKPALSICMGDVETEEVRWMWHPYIPIGKCTAVDGDPGQGKSFLTTKIAACISQGEKLPGMDRKPEPVTTLMLAREDGAGDTIKPRLIACEADCNRIFLLQTKDPLQLDEAGLAILKGEIKRRGAKLVTIDPLNSYLPKGTKITDNVAMRQLIDRLALLAEQTGAAIVIVRHLNKGQGSAIQRGAGVMDTIGGCRSALTVANDPEDEDRHIVAHAKHNLTGRGQSYAFKITKEGKFAWNGTSHLRADDILERKSADDKGAEDAAREFLLEELKNGPQQVAWL
jgi:RecA-family ATPase